LRGALALRVFWPGLPAVLAPPVWPLRWLQAGDEDFAVRELEAPLAGRLPLPLGRAPLPEAVLVWAAVRLPFGAGGRGWRSSAC